LIFLVFPLSGKGVYEVKLSLPSSAIFDPTLNSTIAWLQQLNKSVFSFIDISYQVFSATVVKREVARNANFGGWCG
jgi:hypothetical protein